MDLRSPIAVFICAMSIGILCMSCGVDDVSVWVLEFANSIGWTEMATPVPLPPPMQDFVFRPLSLLFMKLTWVLSDNGLAIPPWLIGLKSALFSAVFGLGAWLWLQRWVSVKAAGVLSIFCMVSEPALFSAFNYSEFDGFGSGLILLSSWWLYRYNDRLLGFAVISFCIVFLKESSFFIWLCFMAPQLFEPYIRSRSTNWSDYKPIGVVVILMSVWLLGTLGVLSGKMQSAAGGLGVLERLPVFQYTVWQLLSLWTEAGIVLALLGYWKRWARVLFAIWLVTALMEPMIAYNHYETHYFSRPWYVTALSISLLITWGCATFQWFRGTQTLFAIMACRGLLMMGLFALVILTSSNLREDLASRLFLSLLPGMLAIVWITVQDCWTDRTLRKIAVVLATLQVWTLSTSAWNWSQRTWFDAGNHAGWTTEMVKNFDRDGSIGRPIWVSDVSRRYSTARMDALLPLQHSVPIEQLEFAPFCYFQSGTPEAFLQSMRSQTGLDTHLLHRGRQLVLSPELLNVVKADFSYLRAKNRGAHGPIQDGDGRCTEYSLIEDRYHYAHSSEDPLLPYLQMDFEVVHKVDAWYYQLPTRLLNLPVWLWNGVPFLQPWRIHQSLWVHPA